MVVIKFEYTVAAAATYRCELGERRVEQVSMAVLLKSNEPSRTSQTIIEV